jgi:hypothetical protein
MIVAAAGASWGMPTPPSLSNSPRRRKSHQFERPWQGWTISSIGVKSRDARNDVLAFADYPALREPGLYLCECSLAVVLCL